MKRSTNRILTTHVGSLIRPEPLREFIRARQTRKSYDEAAYKACLAASVTWPPSRDALGILERSRCSSMSRRAVASMATGSREAKRVE